MDRPKDTGITADRLLGGRVTLWQPRDGYRAAIDPVVLAAGVPARAGQSVLDVGCGPGAAALCLMARVPGVRVSGLERRADHVALARRNAEANGVADRSRFLEGDLLDPPPDLVAGAFDHVMANPPFGEAGCGTVPPHPGRAEAAVEGAAGLAAWVRFAIAMVRPKGSVILIHRADRLAPVLAAMAAGLGELVVFPLWSRAGRPAKRVLVSGRKGVATPLRLDAGLVLHRDDGGFTAEAEAVLRAGAGVAAAADRVADTAAPKSHG